MSGQNVQYELVELPEQREYLLELLAWHNLLGIVMPMLPSSVLSDHQNRYCDRILNRQIRKSVFSYVMFACYEQNSYVFLLCFLKTIFV